MSNILTPHPTMNSPDVLANAVDSILEDILTWLRHDGDPNPDPEETKSALASALRYHRNGYEAARELENTHFWQPDAELVELLDGFSTHQAYKNALKVWVCENKIEIDFQNGGSRHLGRQARRDP